MKILEILLSKEVVTIMLPLILGVLFVLPGRTLPTDGKMEKAAKIIFRILGNLLLIYSLAIAVYFAFF